MSLSLPPCEKFRIGENDYHEIRQGGLEAKPVTAMTPGEPLRVEFVTRYTF